MEFKEITKEEFKNFASNHPLGNFFQTEEMSNVSKLNGWKSIYIGVYKNDQLSLASRIMFKKNRFNKYKYYSIRGPLLDYNDKELLTFFTQNIKKYLKKKHAYIYKIDPTIIHKQRDIEGNIIDGIDNTSIINNLKELGYHHEGFIDNYDYNKQVRWVFCLNLDKSEDEIFNNMKNNTKNLIRKALKYGIKIKELSYDELDIYKKVTEDTCERRNFSDRTLQYYQTVYKEFKDKVKFLLAYINLDEYKDNLTKELLIEKEKLSKIKVEGKLKEINVTINSLNKKIEEIDTLKEENGIEIILSAAMFIMNDKEITYMYSGSYKKYMNFNAQYLIQWYMIKYGIQNNYTKYNFYGITSPLDKQNSEYGIYEFKKGFGGYVEEYIGEFSLKISFYYYIDKFIKKIRK